MPALDARFAAARAYAQSLRTGEGSAAERAAAFLAPDVVLVAGRDEVRGRDAVLKRISGWWPFTYKYTRGVWSNPREGNGQIVVSARLAELGAGPALVTLTFWFDEQDLISRVEQVNGAVPPAAVTDTIPDFVKPLVDQATPNSSPLVVAYTGEDGRPVLSMRGSVQVYSPTQLSLWLRDAQGSLARTLASGAALSLLYRDDTRAMLLFEGRGHLVEDAAVRRDVFERLPEVERNHDPDCHGTAALVDVERLDASTTWGRARMRRPTPSG